LTSTMYLPFRIDGKFGCLQLEFGLKDASDTITRRYVDDLRLLAEQNVADVRPFNEPVKFQTTWYSAVAVHLLTTPNRKPAFPLRSSGMKIFLSALLGMT
ncbi:MAG: hypothetical protein AAF512_22420, partial [Pseudomonadota bacterium]